MKFLFFLFFTAGIISCKPKAAEETSVEVEMPGEATLPAEFQAYDDQIMKVHDEVMPKMSEISRLGTQLKDIKSKAGENAAGMEGLDEAIESLRKAEEWMMDWMKNYHDTKASLTPEHMPKFFEKEMQKIDNVKSTMLNSIDQANEWLATHPAG